MSKKPTEVTLDSLFNEIMEDTKGFLPVASADRKSMLIGFMLGIQSTLIGLETAQGGPHPDRTCRMVLDEFHAETEEFFARIEREFTERN